MASTRTAGGADKDIGHLQGTGSLSRCLAQRGVDALLPARPVRLEEVEDVAVDAQGHCLLGARNRRGLWRLLHLLGGCHLECRLGGVARIGRSSCHEISPVWWVRPG